MSGSTNIGLPGLLLAFTITACAGALMISKFSFNSFKQVDAGARVRYTHILFVPLLFILVAIWPPVTLFLVFGLYALSAPSLWVYRRLRRRVRGAHSSA